MNTPPRTEDEWWNRLMSYVNIEDMDLETITILFSSALRLDIKEFIEAYLWVESKELSDPNILPFIKYVKEGANGAEFFRLKYEVLDKVYLDQQQKNLDWIKTL